MTEDALLAALAADLDDEATLAALADLYQQRGDPRGERIALALAPSSPAVAERIRALRDAHDAAWIAPYVAIAPDLRWFAFDGLRLQIYARPSLFAQHAVALAEQAPLLHSIGLLCNNEDVDFADFGDLRALARARLVSISARRRPRNLDRLRLDDARTLWLDIGGLAAADVDALLAHAPHVHRISFGHAEMAEDALAPLPAYRDQLDELSVFTPIRGLGPLVGALRNLVHLHAPSARFDDAALRAALPAFAKLAWLYIPESATRATIGELLAGLHAVRTLGIGSADLGDVACRAIVRWARASQLEDLDVSSPALTADGVIVLAQATTLTGLTKLSIRGPDLSRRVRRLLLASPGLARCERIFGNEMIRPTK